MIGKKKILKPITTIYLSLLVLIGTNNASYSIENPRDMRNNAVTVSNLNYGENSKYEVDYLKKFSPFAEKTARLKGGVSQMISIVGKSQLIKFDEPVKRISITDPALADIILISRQEMLLNGKASGVTSLIIWGEKGDPVFFDLNVKNDTTAFLEALKEIIPNENNVNIKFVDNTTASSSTSSSDGGTNSSSSTSKNAVLSGRLSSTIVRDKIAALAGTYGFTIVDMTESPTPQVLLEVKVVEASRSFTRNSRVTTTSTADPGNIKFFINPFKYTRIGTLADTIIDPGETAYNPQLAISNIRLPIINSNSTVNLQEQKGIVKVLAEPKLVTLNKQKASFNAGREVPVPSGVDSETGLINFAYKNVGVNLEFTPEILEQTGKIILKLIPEVSEIDESIAVSQGSINIYGMRTRKTETTVELNDGDTLVIAGLIQKNDNMTNSQIPWLGDIPVLGALFSSKEWRKGETELLIFVTPKIIKSDNLVNGV